jgi:hypothetical protein
MFNPRTKPGRQSLRFESLEHRWLFAGLSIGDATAIEGGDALKFIDRFVADGSGGLDRPRASIFGPDGNEDGVSDLYVPSVDTDEVLRYDGLTGAFMDVFIAAGSGGLDDPSDLAFTPDGRLYVSGYTSNQLLYFDHATGAFLGEVSHDFARPRSISLGPDGLLYLANEDSHEVLRYDGSIMSSFVTARSGDLAKPICAIFGPDGNGDGYEDLYISSAVSDVIRRYDGQSGEFMDVFARTELGTATLWLQFGSDGLLYVTARSTAICCDTTLVRFDAVTGAMVDILNLGRDSWSFQFGMDGLVYLSGNGFGNMVDRLGATSLAAFDVGLSEPSAASVSVSYTTNNASATAGQDFVSTSGTLTFAPGQTRRTILVPTLDNLAHESDETFSVVLSNAVGATISDGVGVATITDSDVTGDANGDGIVNLADLNAVRNNFGASGANVAGDTNGDGIVNLNDLNAVRNNFGAVTGNAMQEAAVAQRSLETASISAATQKRQPTLQATDFVFDMLFASLPTKKPFGRR